MKSKTDLATDMAACLLISSVDLNQYHLVILTDGQEVPKCQRNPICKIEGGISLKSFFFFSL